MQMKKTKNLNPERLGTTLSEPNRSIRHGNMIDVHPTFTFEIRKNGV